MPRLPDDDTDLDLASLKGDVGALLSAIDAAGCEQAIIAAMVDEDIVRDLPEADETFSRLRAAIGQG
jgi:hypothetical protein